MKKICSVLIIVCLLVSMLSVGAFAHGGHRRGGHAAAQPRYPLCTTENCAEIGPHYHNDTLYCTGTSRADYAVCTLEGCTETGLHAHDGTYYYCRNHTAGTGCGRNR